MHLAERKLRRERIARITLRSVLVLIMGVLVSIIFYLFVRGAHVLSWKFLTTYPSHDMAGGGIFPAIIGTFYLIALSMLFTFPIGVLSAIYLSEYARDNWVTNFIRIGISNLTGVPSIVFGLFGLSFFSVFLGFKPGLLTASLTLGILALPIMIVASEEAIKAVPQEFRLASLALGATQWQTIWKVVLPSAFHSILTATIIVVGRVAGETAPIIFTGAAFYTSHLPRSLFDQVMALPYYVYVLATSAPDIDATQPIEYGTVLVLMIIVLSINMVAVFLRCHFRRRYRW